jgi:hypothetical protein
MQIGWQALLEGCPALGWEEIQQGYLEWMGSRRTGRRWLVALITKLWEVAWTMWDHRNIVIHDKTNSVASVECNAAIRVELAAGPIGLHADVQALFRQNRQALFRNTLQYRQGWLRRVQASREFRSRQETAPTATGPTPEYIAEFGWTAWLHRARFPALVRDTEMSNNIR